MKLSAIAILLLLVTSAFGQAYLAPVYTVYESELSEEFSNHVGLRAGYRDSFISSRWRVELSGVIGSIENQNPERHEVHIPLTTITSRTDYRWIGINLATDFSLIKDNETKLQPYLGFGIGVYNYRFKEQVRIVVTETGVLEFITPSEEYTLACFAVSGRAGLEYEYSPALRVVATYAFQRLGDPESTSILTPLTFSVHEVGLGLVYHFGYSAKRT